jgi:hypothetical protein
MNTEYQLADTIQETLDNQCSQAVKHTVHLNEENTGAILSEWTLTNGDCVLTNYLNETTAEIEDTLMYVSFVGDQLIEGEFWFDPEVELPTDNI